MEGGRGWMVTEVLADDDTDGASLYEAVTVMLPVVGVEPVVKPAVIGAEAPAARTVSFEPLQLPLMPMHETTMCAVPCVGPLFATVKLADPPVSSCMVMGAVFAVTRML